MIGRLKPGVGREQARGPLMAIAEAAWAGPGVKAPPKCVESFSCWLTAVTDTPIASATLTLPLKLLMGVVGFVLLIACANVANLLLGARVGAEPQRLPSRLAVGASRLRIARAGLLTEGAMLAALAGAAALGVACGWVTSLLQSFQQQTTDVPRTFDGRLDGRALAFTLGLSLFDRLACSLAPARPNRRGRISSKPSRRNQPGLARRLAPGGSLRSLLVVAQVALSLVVLVGAGLLVKSLRALQSIDPGFEPARVDLARVGSI